MTSFFHFLSNGLVYYTFFVGLIGLYLWFNEKNSHWFYFPLFLLLLACLDFCGGYLKNNAGYYSFIVIPFQILFYIWLFYKESLVDKKLVWACTFFYLMSFLIQEFAFKDTKTVFDSFSYSIGNIALLILILHYFFRLSTSDKILQFQHEKMFWVSVGLLVFWLGSLPYFGLLNYLDKYYHTVLVTYKKLVNILDYCMYSLFICAFIWGAKKN